MFYDFNLGIECNMFCLMMFTWFINLYSRFGYFENLRLDTYVEVLEPNSLSKNVYCFSIHCFL